MRTIFNMAETYSAKEDTDNVKKTFKWGLENLNLTFVDKSHFEEILRELDPTPKEEKRYSSSILLYHIASYSDYDMIPEEYFYLPKKDKIFCESDEYFQSLLDLFDIDIKIEMDETHLKCFSDSREAVLYTQETVDQIRKGN